MGQESLVGEQIDAGQSFVRDFSEYLPVAAAFWVNPADSEDWFLYVASKEIDDSNFDVAYGEVLRRVGTNRNQWLDAFQIKLVNSADPVAAEVIDIRDRYPVKTATRYNGSSIAGMAVGGAYIYPPIATTTPAP